MRPARLIVILLTLGLAACAHEINLPPVSAYAPTPYTLDSGDKLRVVVFGQDGLSNSYTVDAAGRVTMPLIGAVPARRLTPAQLAAIGRGRCRGWGARLLTSLAVATVYV